VLSASIIRAMKTSIFILAAMRTWNLIVSTLVNAYLRFFEQKRKLYGVLCVRFILTRISYRLFVRTKLQRPLSSDRVSAFPFLPIFPLKVNKISTPIFCTFRLVIQDTRSCGHVMAISYNLMEIIQRLGRNFWYVNKMQSSYNFWEHD
jgi:hypothetical protein